MNTMVGLAWLGMRAHRAILTGTALTIALAAALLSITGVAIQTGINHPFTDGLLLVLAQSFAGTMLLTVIFVIASTVSLTLRQRRREFALLLATGATRRQVRRLVSLEIGLLTLIAAPIGAVIGLSASPLLTHMLRDAQVLPDGMSLDRTPWPVLAATLVLIPITVGAARIATRETVRISPTAAVQESTLELREVGPVRRVAAVMVAIIAVPMALAPVVTPGIASSAAAAQSAFLLIGAAALAGPRLVAWLFGPTQQMQSRCSGAPTRLALANSRGFARRLSTVVMPLAVVLSVGTVQTGSNHSVQAATAEQLRAGTHVSLVATSATGLSSRQINLLSKISGVRGIEASSTAPVQVRTDGDVPSAISSLAWESTQLRSLAATPNAAIDPDITSGSLKALAHPGAIAISEQARVGSGLRLGSQITLRSRNTLEHTATIVAVYSRGLAFGDYLVAPTTLRTITASRRNDTALLQVAPAQTAAVARQARRLGTSVMDKTTYVQQSTRSNGATQNLATTLLLVLLIFVGIAAANSLTLMTAGRRRELSLLRRTGATRRQLFTMSVLESLIISAAAWVVGTLAVLPALTGVNYGLTGVPAPRIDLPTYALLSAAVLFIPLLCNTPTVLRQVRAKVPSHPL